MNITRSKFILCLTLTGFLTTIPFQQAQSCPWRVIAGGYEEIPPKSHLRCAVSTVVSLSALVATLVYILSPKSEPQAPLENPPHAAFDLRLIHSLTNRTSETEPTFLLQPQNVSVLLDANQTAPGMPNGKIVEYVWMVDDVELPTRASSIVVSVSSLTPHRFTLVAKDDAQRTDATTRTAFIGGGGEELYDGVPLNPVADFFYQAMGNNQILFNASTSYARARGASTVLHEWRFDQADWILSLADSLFETLNNSHVYTVAHRLTDSNKQSNEQSHTLYIDTQGRAFDPYEKLQWQNDEVTNDNWRCGRPYALERTGVYNAHSGAVEWKTATIERINPYAQNDHRCVVRPYAGVYNPSTRSVEWRLAELDPSNTALRNYPLPHFGVYNPVTQVDPYASRNIIHVVRPYFGVFNPAIGAVEWKLAELDPIDSRLRNYPLPYFGVYNPAAYQVEWRVATLEKVDPYATRNVIHVVRPYFGAFNAYTQSVEWQLAEFTSSDMRMRNYPLPFFGLYSPELQKVIWKKAHIEAVTPHAVRTEYFVVGVSGAYASGINPTAPQ
jgi:hypothetical protein